ncbi:MAG: hypothetical protein H6644_15910 [Caldilineaceae bacterium]|nr:hypothetical protein [Caldilineaceae bacterium]
MVETVAPDVTAWQPGMRVAVAHHAPDPASHYTWRGSGPMDPGFKATNIDPRRLCRADPGAGGAGGADGGGRPGPRARSAGGLHGAVGLLSARADRAPVQEGDVALIVGAGAVGMLFVPLLRDRSATVIAADIRAAPLSQAAAGGGHGAARRRYRCRGGTQRTGAARTTGADLVILTALTPQTLALAQHACAMAARSCSSAPNRAASSTWTYGTFGGANSISSAAIRARRTCCPGPWQFWPRTVGLWRSWSVTRFRLIMRTTQLNYHSTRPGNEGCGDA